LRFISLELRRTVSTPRGTRFARLDLGLFTKSSIRMAFYEAITLFELLELYHRSAVFGHTRWMTPIATRNKMMRIHFANC
jgi:hypothetical protein